MFTIELAELERQEGVDEWVDEDDWLTPIEIPIHSPD